MEFFISDALAQSGGDGGGLISLIPLVLIFVLFYFLLIRPQQKRTKKHKEMVGSLEVGDEVVTNGGLLGKITQVDSYAVKLRVAEGVVVDVQRQAIAQLIPSATIDSTEESRRKPKKKKRIAKPKEK